MAATKVLGLHAIGEAVDVTGWLGGSNFEWTWRAAWRRGRQFRNPLRAVI
jgi:predicted flavoprotein YhiN